MQILKDYFSQIDLDETRVLNLPEIFFLFGGRFNSDHNAPPLSVRDALLRHLTINMPNVASRVVLVEDIKTWSEHKLFADLLDFENHISHLAKLIVLIVESAGSIAELGSFTILPAIKLRLFVVISQNFNDAQSFISLGPIKKLRDDHKSVYVYPWTTIPPESIPSTPNHLEISEIIGDLAADIKSEIGKKSPSTKLETEDPGHISLLISEILAITTTLKIGELEIALSNIGITISNSELQRNLFILSSLELISIFNYGNETYYFASTENRYIALQLNGTANQRLKDRSRVISEFTEHYEKNDARRWKAISSYRKKLSTSGGAT